MSAGDHGARPSVPHAMTRVRTDRAPTIPPDEADTKREEIAVPQLLTVEEWKQWQRDHTDEAVKRTRADERLHFDTRLGAMESKIDDLFGTTISKRRRREVVSLVGFVASLIASGIMGIWMAVAPRAREAAEVAVIAPAIEAKRVATVAVETTDDHEERLTKVEQTQRQILGAIEKLNGAVVMVIDRLPAPEPTHIDVPAPVAVPRRGKKAGLDE